MSEEIQIESICKAESKIRSPVIMIFSIDSEGILALISTTLFTSVTITTTMMINFCVIPYFFPDSHDKPPQDFPL